MHLSIPTDYSYSFSDKTQKDTSYITHSYYTYPKQLENGKALSHNEIKKWLGL